jgi:hypothetical protein
VCSLREVWQTNRSARVWRPLNSITRINTCITYHHYLISRDHRTHFCHPCNFCFDYVYITRRLLVSCLLSNAQKSFRDFSIVCSSRVNWGPCRVAELHHIPRSLQVMGIDWLFHLSVVIRGKVYTVINNLRLEKEKPKQIRIRITLHVLCRTMSWSEIGTPGMMIC